MMEFEIPPRISGGQLNVAGASLSVSDFTWQDLQVLSNDGSQMTTAIGEAEVAGRPVQVRLGYSTEDKLPLFDLTIWAPFANDVSCSFDFAEVQQ